MTATFDINELLNKAVSERIAFIEKHKERIVTAWVAQHGWNPGQCQLVQQEDGPGRMRMWVEKRGDFAELQRFREREPMVRALCGAVEDHPYGDVAPIDAWRVLVDWEMDHRLCDSSATETSDQADASAASEPENA